MSELMFPKTKSKRKRKVHRKSILHNKEEGTCYLCMLKGDYRRHPYLEEHHIFFGNPWRQKSEEWGLKVYLCEPCHRSSKEAVHRNAENNRLLKQIAQRAFEEKYSHDLFMEEFGENYLD